MLLSVILGFILFIIRFVRADTDIGVLETQTIGQLKSLVRTIYPIHDYKQETFEKIEGRTWCPRHRAFKVLYKAALQADRYTEVRIKYKREVISFLELRYGELDRRSFYKKAPTQFERNSIKMEIMSLVVGQLFVDSKYDHLHVASFMEVQDRI